MSGTQIAKSKARTTTSKLPPRVSENRSLSHSLEVKTRRVSIGVAFIARLSNTVAAARRVSNVPANTTGRARDDSLLATGARRRSEIEGGLRSLAICSTSQTDLRNSPTLCNFSLTRCTLISQQQAAAIDEELFNEYGFSVDQLMELAGLASAIAFSAAYPRNTLTKAHGAVLVCCGPGNNGGDGLVCARHLKLFGYQPTIFYPKVPDKTLFKNLLKQCEKFEIPSLAYLPSDLNSIQQSFNVLVDAVLGFSFKPPIREEFVPLMRTLRQINIPIFSIDIPSGWDVEKGPHDADAIQPDVLISLTAPKLCARYFVGRKHYLGGRFVPRLLALKYGLRLPEYPGIEQVVELALSSGTTSATDADAESSENDSANAAKPTAADVWGAT